MYTVYILRSESKQKFYIGHTEDVALRLLKHNQGKVRSTKAGIPWSVVHREEFSTRSEAYRRELEIKRYKGGIQFKLLMKS